jgi:phytol kinase
MKAIFSFIQQFVPPFPQIFIYSLISAAAILASGFICGALKRHFQWQTGYTRKLLHFIIFFTAVGLHIWGGMPAVNMLGIGMGIFVLGSIWAGKGNLFYEAMAREKDAPQRSFFIFVPYISTALGGLTSNLLFGSSAIMGYVLCGAGDAIAEPVGLRFGKHSYRVISLRKVKVSERTVEGSASIFIVCLMLSFLFFNYFYHLSLSISIIASLLTAFVIVVVEAVSFHGADNFTIQVVASALTYSFVQIWG